MILDENLLSSNAKIYFRHLKIYDNSGSSIEMKRYLFIERNQPMERGVFLCDIHLGDFLSYALLVYRYVSLETLRGKYSDILCIYVSLFIMFVRILLPSSFALFR